MKLSYTPEKAWAEMQGELPLYLIYRPLSIYLTLPFLALRVPILAVTLSSLALSIVMLGVAWRGAPDAYLWVAGLGFTFHVVDCLDGNMARTTGQSSRFGALVDGTVDMTFWCALFLSIGLLVDHAGGGLLGRHAISFSLGCAVLVLLNRQTRDNFTNIFSVATYFVAQRPEKISPGDRFLMAVLGLETLYVFAIAIGGWLGELDRVLVAIGVYVALIFIGALAMTFKDAAAEDRHD
ncbi:MAG: CDP-alcohol phosphatidyltransferase family protein [Deltaproteobacteria bacterium]|nr:CDP-alcohol phosphatidyltransferase family protein [Deltaproteobacteria bacterium]